MTTLVGGGDGEGFGGAGSILLPDLSTFTYIRFIKPSNYHLEMHVVDKKLKMEKQKILRSASTILERTHIFINSYLNSYFFSQYYAVVKNAAMDYFTYVLLLYACISLILN